MPQSTAKSHYLSERIPAAKIEMSSNAIANVVAGRMPRLYAYLQLQLGLEPKRTVVLTPPPAFGS
jgi:hypothetical protein